VVVNPSGFEIISPALSQVSVVDVAVQVLVTTQQQNMRRLDPSIHCLLKLYENSMIKKMWTKKINVYILVEYKKCQLSLNSIKHARWFEENASHST
jgi:hypothetical protein